MQLNSFKTTTEPIMQAIHRVSPSKTVLNFFILSLILPAPSSAQSEDLLLQHGFLTKIHYSPIKRSEKPRRCAGVIYNAHWIITSAKCAVSSWRRKVGNATHDLADILYLEDIPLPTCKPQDQNHYRYVVDAAVQPGLGNWAWGFLPKHVQPDPALDIALLKVNEPFEFSKDFRPIRLPETKKDCGTDKAYFLGWDVTKGLAAEKKWSNELHKIEMDVLDEKECKANDPKFDPATRICARGPKGIPPVNGSTCYSDIGGPLVRVVDVNLKGSAFTKGEQVLCGILPMSSCKRADTGKDTEVEFFTNVMKHVSWITKIAGPTTEWAAPSTEPPEIISEDNQQHPVSAFVADSQKDNQKPVSTAIDSQNDNQKPVSTTIDNQQERNIDQCNFTAVTEAQELAHAKIESLSTDIRTLAESVGKMVQVLKHQRTKIHDLSAKLVLQNELVALLQAKIAKFAQNQTLLTKKATKIDLILHEDPLPAGRGRHFVTVGKGR